MGRPRKFKTAKALAEAWEEYKNWCGDQKVLTHDFSAKNSEFVSKELTRSVTCTIEGFCVWVGIRRQSFYDTYASNPKFSDMFAEQDGKEIQLAACKMVIPAIICTLREYDRIKRTETSD